MTQTSAVGSLGNITGITATDTRANAARPQTASPVATAADQAKLSVAGGLASQASSDVRMDKVQSLQAAISSGTYNISAADVAGKMVDSLLE